MSDFPPDLKEKEINELRLSAWEIDCPIMTVKCRDRPAPATYYGAGKIFIFQDGKLGFRCYSHRERNTKEWDFNSPVKSGTIIPDHIFYDLKAVDVLGHKWTSQRTLPNVYRTATGRSIISGHLDEIRSTGAFPEDVPISGSAILFWVFEDIKIPANQSTVLKKSIAGGKLRSRSGSRNTWKFRCNKVDYLLIKESDDQLSVRITSANPQLPKYFEHRAVEGFHFVLGQPLNWMVMKIRNGHKVEIRIRSKRPAKSQLRAPIPTSLIHRSGSKKMTAEYHRRLFDKYLRYSMSKVANRHPIWGQINAISEASSSSFLDAKALTLTVAIESLLFNEFPDIGTPSEKSKVSIEQIREYIDNWKGDNVIKRRVLGMISNLHSTRAIDRMRALAEKGAISEQQHKSWNKLRNPTTHSYLTSGMPTNKMLRLLQECDVLFYHLVFYAIGYKGPYTDYATPGWPLKRYPGDSFWN